MFGAATPSVFMLIRLRINVVRAKALNPKGAGFAIPFVGAATD
jgi:hypothetical protein